MKKRILANLNWLFADRILRLVGGLFIGIWIARYLGPGNFGLLNFALSFASLFGLVGRITIEQVVVRELTKFPENTGVILGSIFRLKLWGGMAAALFAIPAAWMAQPDNPLFIFMVAAIAIGFVFNAIDAIDVFYQAKVISKLVVQIRAVTFLFFSAGKIGLIQGEYPVIWFAVLTTLEMASGSLLLAWFYHKREGFTDWKWSTVHAKMLLRDGWPLIASSLLIIIHTRIDQVMLGQMQDETQVGLYSAAVKVSEAWLFIPGMIVQTVMPYFVRLRETDPIRYQQRLMQLYSAMFWLGAIAGLVAIAAGKPFIIALFGNSYVASYEPLVLIVWTGIFNSQAVARGIWMISENFQFFRLMNNLVSVPLNIGLNLYLIPNYGITGAAFASLVSVGLGTWLLPLLFKPVRESTIDLIRSVNPRYLLR